MWLPGTEPESSGRPGQLCSPSGLVLYSLVFLFIMRPILPVLSVYGNDGLDTRHCEFYLGNCLCSLLFVFQNLEVGVPMNMCSIYLGNGGVS